MIAACWGLGALAGTVLGVAQLRLRPARLGDAVTWWRYSGWPLGRWLGLDSSITVMKAQVLVFCLAPILGVNDLGGLRAVEAVYAPLTLLIQALELPGVPHIADELKRSQRAARSYAARLSALALGLVLAYLLILGIPREQVLAFVFGSSFTSFSSLVIPVGAAELLGASTIGLGMFIKADRRGRSLIVYRLVGAVATFAVVVSLAHRSGLQGAAWGFVVAAAVAGATVISLALRESDVRFSLLRVRPAGAVSQP
jgi:O-antigen/teichoic acid export membrane protein